MCICLSVSVYLSAFLYLYFYIYLYICRRQICDDCWVWRLKLFALVAQRNTAIWRMLFRRYGSFFSSISPEMFCWSPSVVTVHPQIIPADFLVSKIEVKELIISKSTVFYFLSPIQITLLLKECFSGFGLNLFSIPSCSGCPSWND